MFWNKILRRKSADVEEKVKSSKKDPSNSPHSRTPELYYGHVWLDHKTFELVELFADRQKISLKSAVFHLLRFGVQFYVAQQIKLEQAYLSHTIAEHTKLYSVEDLARLIKHVGKAKKFMTKEGNPEDKTPA